MATIHQLGRPIDVGWCQRRVYLTIDVDVVLFNIDMAAIHLSGRPLDVCGKFHRCL